MPSERLAEVTAGVIAVGCGLDGAPGRALDGVGVGVEPPAAGDGREAACKLFNAAASLMGPRR